MAAIDYKKHFPAFCKLIGMPEILDDPDYNTSEAYYKNKAALTHIFDGVFAQKTTKEWHELLESADLPHEILRHFRDVPDDPQAIANHYVKKYEYKDGTKTVFVNGPVHFRSVVLRKFEYKISGPIGRDTAEVLAELGYTQEQIKAMYEAQEVK